MGYKIIYPPVGKRRYPMGRSMPVWLLPASILGAAILAITLYNGSAGWLLPGDPEVTEAALYEMIERLSEGEAFGEAVTAFCKEIIAGAG